MECNRQRELMEVPRFSCSDHVISSHVLLCLIAVGLQGFGIKE